MDEVRPYLYGRSKGNPVGIRDSRHYCIGESLDARPLGHEPEKGSRKASAIPQARRPALHPKVRCILGKGGGRPEQLKQQALPAALLASGSPLFREEREGSMKHQPERGQRVLAFLLAGTLAWSQVPVSALAETQDTAQQTETEETATAASTKTESTAAASDTGTGASAAASEKSAPSAATAEESVSDSAASEAQDSSTGADQSRDQGTDKSTV